MLGYSLCLGPEQPCVDVGNSLADRSSSEEASSFGQEDDKLSCRAVRTEGAMHCTSGKSKDLLPESSAGE